MSEVAEPKPMRANPPGQPECLRLYEQMVLLRQFEVTAQKNCKAGRMPGFIRL